MTHHSSCPFGALSADPASAASRRPRMRALRVGLLAVGLASCLLIPATAGAGQDPEAAGSGSADVVRSQLTLNLRPVSVSFDPTLSAEDPDHRELLAEADAASAAPVRIGDFDVMPLLRIGTLDGAAFSDGPPGLQSRTYALWLARTGSGWSLDLHAPPEEADAAGEEADEGEAAEEAESGDDESGIERSEAEHSESGDADHEAGHDDSGDHDAADSDASDEVSDPDAAVARIPLTRTAAAVQETLSAALVPTSEDAGQLVVRWRDHRWAADFHFEELPERVEAAAPEPPEEDEEDEGPRVANDRESLRFDSDTSAGSRLLQLAERHETAFEAPGGARVAVLFWQEQSVELAEFAALGTLADGEVVRLTQAAVLRLRSEAPLQFGEVTIPTANLAPGFAGSYGLWLKRSGDGWRLVFNHEADSWGTQHDPAFDAAEIDLEYAADGLAERPLGAALVPLTGRDGRLVLHWGPHEWAADYRIAE